VVCSSELRQKEAVASVPHFDMVHSSATSYRFRKATFKIGDENTEAAAPNEVNDEEAGKKKMKCAQGRKGETAKAGRGRRR
jgi:C4-type Zn-finger protein